MFDLVSLEKVIPVLAIIFVAVFALILLVRLVFFFLMHHALKQYEELKKAAKKIIPKSKKYIKEEEALMRYKEEIPRAHSEVKAELRLKNQSQSGSYELIRSEEQELDKEEMNSMQIVDIVKPIGFWTSMILGQKLTYLIQSAQVINKREKQGFWVSMIEAKERQAGREHGRGR